MDTVTVKVTERVECFLDKWDYKTENHYTEDWEEVQENFYGINVSTDGEGNIVEEKEEIEKKVNEVAVGEVLDFEVLY